MGPRSNAGPVASQSTPALKQLNTVLETYDELPRSFRRELMVPMQPTVAEIKAMHQTKEDRVVNPLTWQADCRDLHKVLQTCQAVYLVFEHVFNNEAMLRVAVEIVLCPRAKKLMWWRDGWWPDAEKRDLFKDIIREKLRISLMQFKHSQEHQEDEKTSELNAQLEKLVERVKAMEMSINAKDKEIQVLTTNNQALGQQLTDANQSRKNLNNTVDELRKQVRTLQGSLDALKSQDTGGSNEEEIELRMKAEARCQLMHEKILDLEKNLKDILEARVPKEDLYEAQQKIADLEKALEKANKQHHPKTIEKEVAPATTETRKTEKEGRWKGMKGNGDKEESTVKALQTQLEDARRTAEDFRRRLQLAEEDKRIQEETTKTLREQYQKAKSQLDKAVQQSKELGEMDKDHLSKLNEAELRAQQAEARALKAEAAVVESASDSKDACIAAQQAAGKIAEIEAAAKAEAARLEGQVKTLQEQVIELEEDLRTSRSKLHDEALSRSAAEERAGAAQAEANAALEECQRAQDECQRVKDECQRVKDEYQRLSIEARSRPQVQDLKALQEERASKAEELLQAQAKIDALAQQLQKAEEMIAEHVASLQEAGSRLEQKENQLTEAKEALITAQTETLEVREQLAARPDASVADELLAHKAAKQVLERELAAQTAKFQEAQNTVISLEKRLAEVQEALDALKQTVASKEDAMKAKELELQQAREALKATSGQDRDAERVRGELAKSEAKVQELTTSWDECRTKIKAQATELQTQRQEAQGVQEKLDRALKTIHVVKSQIDKLQALAKGNGTTKQVEDVMNESGMIEYLNNPEWSIWERLYQDAKRRQNKHEQLEKVMSGQLTSMAETTSMLTRSRTGIGSLPRALTHAFSERIGIMPSLHLDSIDDDSDKSASGLPRCPRCGFSMFPARSSPRSPLESVKARSRFGSCATELDDVSSPRPSESTKTPRNLQVITTPSMARSVTIGTTPQQSQQDASPSRPASPSGHEELLVEGSGLPAKRRLLSAVASWTLPGSSTTDPLSPKRQGSLTSTWSPTRLRRLKTELLAAHKEADEPTAMEKDCGSALIVSSYCSNTPQASRASSPADKIHPQSSSFGAGTILHRRASELEREQPLEGQEQGDGQVAGPILLLEQLPQSRPGSSSKRFEGRRRRRSTASTVAGHGEVGNTPFAGLPSRPSSREAASAEGLTPTPNTSSVARAGSPPRNIRWPKKSSESMVHSLSLPGLQAIALDKRTSAKWPARRGSSASSLKKPRQGQQTIIPRAGWFGFPTGERDGSKDGRRQSPDSKDKPRKLQELRNAAAEAPAVASFLKELSE